MTDLTSVIVGAFIGLAGSFILFLIRDILLHTRRTKEEHKRSVIQRRLEKLYSPLYQNIMTTEALTKKRALSYSHSVAGSPEESRGKVFLDSIIENHLYLADDELMELLPKIHGPLFYQEESKPYSEKIIELVVDGYTRLRHEYLSFGR